MVDTQIIRLHRQAPPKPPLSAPCNGCGVCCAAETCPLARLRFWQRHGPCPALEWSETAARYHCGLILRPTHYFPGIGGIPAAWRQRLLRRWIAAGQGCDSDALAVATAP